MKRLLKIGGGLFIYSIIPILCWIILSNVWHDNRINNVFSITYCVQCLWGFLKYFFGSGACIKKEKENDLNSVQNSMFWGVIITSVIFGLLLIFADKFILFFNLDVGFYKPYVMYSFALIYLQVLFSLVLEKLYFEDNENAANKHLICFNAINFLVLIVCALITTSKTVTFGLTLAVLGIYIICLYILQFKKFKISFGFIKNFKYESANIISMAFFMIIYFFGFKTAFSAGTEYLMAINLVSLCTDTQWDMLTAIQTVAKIDISKNRFNYKEHLKTGYFYGLIIMASSLIMMLILSAFNTISLGLLFAYLTFQLFDMALNPFIHIISTYTQLEYSATLNTILNFSFKALRMLFAITIISPFCTDIGQISQSIGLVIAFLILRFTKFKLHGNTLTIKTKGE